jgi:hypothetical protein
MVDRCTSLASIFHSTINHQEFKDSVPYLESFFSSLHD